MKFSPQHDQMDFGPACLKMIASAYGKDYPLQYLRDHAFITREGVSLSGISQAAEKIGFETLAVKVTAERLADDLPFPCILHWNQNHFVVLRQIKSGCPSGKTHYKIADPGHGLLILNEENFKKSWLSEDEKGVALFLEPSEKFYECAPSQA